MFIEVEIYGKTYVLLLYKENALVTLSTQILMIRNEEVDFKTCKYESRDRQSHISFCTLQLICSC